MDLVLVAFGYLLGALPFALWFTRSSGVDIREVGSRNPGFSNVLRVLGPRYGIPVLLGDLGKGAVAAGAAWAGSDSRVVAFAAGVAAMLGHCFPPYNVRKGGRGVATAGGLLLVLVPVPTLILLGTWGVVALLLKKASVASLLDVFLAPVLVAAFGYPGEEVFGTAAAACVVLVRHHDNIRRLIRGEEQGLAPGT